MIYKDLFEVIGGTPLLRLAALSRASGSEVYAKLEGQNPTGSVKDRAATYILESALRLGLIDHSTLVIESTSGNFGVALANACRHYGIQCICICDANVTPMHRFLIEKLGADVEVISETDEAGGYLNSRLQRVRELLDRYPRSFWTNQYANRNNWMAHFLGTGREIFEQAEGRVDYLFSAVSSGGTIMGCARYLKEKLPDVRVIAADVEGSVIFGSAPKARFIPGVGSSRVPEILDRTLVDDVVHVSEQESVRECHRLVKEEGILVGGSAGTVCAAIRAYFQRPERQGRGAVVAAVFADRGDRYFQTLYDRSWVSAHYPDLEAEFWANSVEARTEGAVS